MSDAAWDPADANRPGEAYDRLSIGHKYLDNGTLYVARFHADGSGEWLPLTPEAETRDGRTLAAALGLEENDLAGVIINTCDAADLLGPRRWIGPNGPLLTLHRARCISL